MNKLYEAQRAGRGLLAITGAKVYFIVTSYAVQLFLPQFLGSPQRFGLFATVMNIVSIVNNVLIAATVQAVSKRVSEQEAEAPFRIREALQIQLVLGFLLFMSLWFGAPSLSEDVLLDTQLTSLFRIASVVVLSYALYAVFVGALNGRRLFSKQASLDITFSTFRTIGILSAAFLGFGAQGALTGFASAAVCILLVAMTLVGFGKSSSAASLKTWHTWMAPLWLYQIFLNGIMQIDLAVLKRTVAALGIAAGQTGVAAAELASEYAGYYRAAQTFAFVPYQLILSVTFIIFPLVSKATSEGDLQTARMYVRSAMRFSLLFVLAVAAPLAGASDGVMRLAYPEPYLVAAPTLRLLVFGQSGLALFVIAATILSSAGQPGRAAGIAATALGFIVLGIHTAIHKTGIGEKALEATAWGTTLGIGFALLLAGTTVFFRFGTFIPWKSCARAAVAATAAFGAAYVCPSHNALGALVALTAGFFAYVAALFITQELGKEELYYLKRLRSKTG